MRTTIWTFLLLACTQYAQAQSYGGIVINEIMIDPSPQIGLPNAEWVELKNMGASAVNLQGWRIGDASGISGPMPSFTLLPDSFVIVSSAGNAASLSSFGKTISVTSFPSLDNDADLIYLKAANGLHVHAINYNTNYYHNPTKIDGGWTLEMIDATYCCAGETNWLASSAIVGGTPGKVNSCKGTATTSTYPKLIRSFATDSITISLFFDQIIDSSSAVNASNYQFSPLIPIQSVTAKAPLFQEVIIKLAQPIFKGNVYQLYASNIKDCKGNTAIGAQMVKAGLCSNSTPGDWIINEVLFNPYSGGYDFVELYNKSANCLNAEKIFLASRNSTGNIIGTTALKNGPFTIFPGDYIVVTEKALNLMLYYITGNRENIFEVASLPSMPDDAGNILTMNSSGIIVDELNYKEDWHYKLLGTTEGVSLERISPSGKTQDPGNWQSSAESIGFATPGYKNSQLMDRVLENSVVSVNPSLFSPDFDGIDDIAVIQYKLDNTNYSANINIYDEQGKIIKFIAHQQSIGTTGQWKWDGLTEKGSPAPMGIYIIAGQIYNTTGAVFSVKLPVILARKNH
jgi:hypothetical protein